MVMFGLMQGLQESEQDYQRYLHGKPGQKSLGFV